MLRSLLLLIAVCSAATYASNVRKFVDRDIRQASELGGNRYFIELFAPWCGHCKALAPTWEKLADHYADDDSVTIGSVDCTTEVVTKALFTVRGYPTLKLITNGKVYNYDGARDFKSLRRFVDEKLYLNQDSTDMYPEVESDVVSDVDTLNAKTFYEDVQRRPTFVRFFSPNCAKSAKQSPSWEQFGREQFPKGELTVAEVDCTTHRRLCSEFHVVQFPMLVFIKDGIVYQYTGAHDIESYNAFAARDYKRLKGSPLKRDPLPTGVVNLTPDNFEKNLMNHPGWLTYFISGKTTQGKELDAVFEGLAADYSHAFTSGRFDCDQSPTSCDVLGVSSLPEIRLVFGVNQFVYPAGRPMTAEDILEWVTKGKFRDVQKTERASLLGRYQLTMRNLSVEAWLETLRRNYIFASISVGLALLYGILLVCLPCCVGGRTRSTRPKTVKRKKE